MCAGTQVVPLPWPPKGAVSGTHAAGYTRGRRDGSQNFGRRNRSRKGTWGFAWHNTGNYTRQHGFNIFGNETKNVPCSFIVNLQGHMPIESPRIVSREVGTGSAKLF